MAPLMKIINHISRRYVAQFTERQKRLYPQVEQTITEEGYPMLKFGPSNRNQFASRPKIKSRRSSLRHKGREEYMDPEQDWVSIWPTAKTFSPAAVPLPLRQSYEEKSNAPRSKYFNTELIKISNFLHLTPVAIKRHCDALKKFCTKWPEGLETDEDIKYHLPITYIYTDYVHASPNIRDIRSRIVTLTVNTKKWEMDKRQRDKMCLLAGHRYDKETGDLTIVASACPMRVQNLDYANYLLTALYFESMKYEKWEDEKPEEIDIRPDLDAYRLKVEKELGLQ